jgi:O-antigen ligase
MDIFPENIRACLFLLAAYGFATLYILIFYRYKYLLKWSACWAIITCAAFLSGHIAGLIVVVVFLSTFLLPKKSSEQLKYYFVLLPALPLYVYEVSGPLNINLVLELTYARLLSLAILFPAFVMLAKESKGFAKNFLNEPLDKLILLYVLLLCVLSFRNTTITSGLRESFRLIFLDIFLPYYVISRSIQSINDFRRVFVGILFSAIMLSFLGLFEQKLHWPFFLHLVDDLGFRPFVYFFGEVRGIFLRISTTMAPIPLGYFMIFAIAILLFVKNLLPKRKLFVFATMALFIITLVFTGSRGAWLTAIVFCMLYTYLKMSDVWLKMSLVVGGIGLIFLGNLTLSMIGGLSADSVDEHGTFQYRIDLIISSINIIKDNFLFGTENPNQGGALESMRQGQGIIDIVNTYLALLLFQGISGFSLFLAIFSISIRGVYVATKSMKKNKKVWLLGNMLTAMVIATLVMIGTVSSVNFIPIYYWSLIGFASAYIRMSKSYQFRYGIAEKNSEQMIPVHAKLTNSA